MKNTGKESRGILSVTGFQLNIPVSSGVFVVMTGLVTECLVKKDASSSSSSDDADAEDPDAFNVTIQGNSYKSKHTFRITKVTVAGSFQICTLPESCVKLLVT